MRNSIIRSTINVTVDRIDLVDVAGVETLRGLLPLYPRAIHASATAAHATPPGCKTPGKCVLDGKRLHCLPVMGQRHQAMSVSQGHPRMSAVMQERNRNSWRTSRSFASRRFAAAIG